MEAMNARRRATCSRSARPGVLSSGSRPVRELPQVGRRQCRREAVSGICWRFGASEATDTAQQAVRRCDVLQAHDDFAAQHLHEPVVADPGHLRVDLGAGQTSPFDLRRARSGHDPEMR